MAKGAMLNHNEKLLLLFNGTITASCLKQLFNLVSICYYYQYNKNYKAFKAAVLKGFSAKHPFDTTHRPRRTSQTFLLKCGICTATASSSIAMTTTTSSSSAITVPLASFVCSLLSSGGEPFAVECMPILWWGCFKEDCLRVCSTMVEAVAAGSTPNIVKICRSIMLLTRARTVLTRLWAPYASSSRAFPTKTTSILPSRACVWMCSTSWTE